MLSISPPWLVALSIVATALAQILLKQSSFHDVLSGSWFVFVSVAAASYGIAFVFYAFILKTYPINKVYPATTMAQIAIVTLYGLAVGESIDTRHLVGLAFAVVAIYLILG